MKNGFINSKTAFLRHAVYSFAPTTKIYEMHV